LEPRFTSSTNFFEPLWNTNFTLKGQRVYLSDITTRLFEKKTKINEKNLEYVENLKKKKYAISRLL
jgi:hypothetical protein